jgi:hypothetical protein
MPVIENPVPAQVRNGKHINTGEQAVPCSGDDPGINEQNNKKEYYKWQKENIQNYS